MVDPLSPIAPARVRALLLPVGRIKRTSFMTFTNLIQAETAVRLGDVTPDSRPDRNMFSPLAFPGGRVLYEMATSQPTPSQLSLSPLELFREPLVIIGVADGKEYEFSTAPDASSLQSSEAYTIEEANVSQFRSELRDAVGLLREQYSRTLVVRLFMFNCAAGSSETWLPPDTTVIPPVEQLKTTTMKTAMCDLTGLLLAEMTTLARSYQALPSIASPGPGQGGGSAGGYSHLLTDPPPLMRSNSQLTNGIRSASPAVDQHNSHRMSMPAHLPSSVSPVPLDGSRPGTPASGTRTPPVTFEEIAGPGPAVDRSGLSSSNAPSRPSSTSRDVSRDRVSVHGFGSGSVSERARNKGKGRVGLVLSTLYMLAGRWQDAMRELVEHTTKARAFSDHLWHGKGLENILVCMLLLLWAGTDFQIPQIVSPIAGKTSSTKSSTQTPSASATDVPTLGSPKSSTRGNAARNLADLLPELIETILSIYARAANFAGEAMPQLALSECTIRFARLLAAVNVANGVISDAVLQHLVVGVPFAPSSDLSTPKPTIRPTKHDISSMLHDALPHPSEASRLPAVDCLRILSGIAAVLSSLGLRRQKALIVKEFIAVLVPALVQARKVGAAEMGIHPAAGLSELNTTNGLFNGAEPLQSGQAEIESGVDHFLASVCRTYGIPAVSGSSETMDSDQQVQDSLDPGESDLRNAALVKRLSDLSAYRSFGSLNLKLDILRICIGLCEALPDFEGVLHFTAALLRAAGPARAPNFSVMGVLVMLAKEEQIRLATNFSRTINAAKTIGLEHLETYYWDDFLVRGLTLVEPPPSKLLSRHRKVELESTKHQKEANGPFIHNPFIKKPESLGTEMVLAAGEQHEFVVTLQNLYEFELEIESLKLACDGVDLETSQSKLWLGPYRAQQFAIAAVARSTGTARITGCVVKIRGCRERLFPIFSEPWRARSETKIKEIGLRAVDAPGSRPVSSTSTSFEVEHAIAKPITSSLALAVLPQQPVIKLSHTSIPQSALMVLEGERKVFSITLENVTDTAVDFVHISLQDSTVAPLQAALSNKTLSSAEFYEYERQLLDACVRLHASDEGQPRQINPRDQRTFQIEVLGRYGLTECTVQFDYAHLGVPSDQISDKFYTRQISVPIAITVNAAVQLHRIDIVPFLGDFAWSNQHRQRAFSRPSSEKSMSRRLLARSPDDVGNPFKSLLGRVGRGTNDTDHCLMLLDLRNGWPNPLSISIQVREKPSGDDTPDEEWRRAYTVHSLIQPGHVERLLMLLPKVYLKNPHEPIPSLNPANQRQYVVSASKISPETERANREHFWCREVLLKNIRGTWEDETSGRKGEIDLRGIRLSSKMIEAMRLDEIAIEMSVTSGMNGTANSVRQFGRSRFEINVDDRLVLTTKVHNRSASPILPLLRLQPRLANQPHDVALDLVKRFACDGLLQRVLPLLRSGQTVEAALGICASCAGNFEIGAVVEEIQPWHEEQANEVQKEAKPGTGRLQDDLLGGVGKRVWHAVEVCSIVAKQAEIGWINDVIAKMTESGVDDAA